MKAIAILFVSLVVGLCGAILWLQSAPPIPAAWARIVPGMTDAQVEVILGPNARYDDCTHSGFMGKCSGSPWAHGQGLELDVRMARTAGAGEDFRWLEPRERVCESVTIERHQRNYAIRRYAAFLRLW